jgi:very-short-patch-repair endonuclease
LSKPINQTRHSGAFVFAASKHFDFIVCEPTDCSVKLAVELDDSSHGSSKAQKRDSFLNGACQSAGVPLLRIKAAKSYTVADLKRQLEESISPQLAEPEPLSPLAAVETAAVKLSEEGSALAEPKEAKLEPHVCAKCGEPMVLRKAKSGANAGQEFWGCSAFPRCRAVVPTGA